MWGLVLGVEEGVETWGGWVGGGRRFDHPNPQRVGELGMIAVSRLLRPLAPSSGKSILLSFAGYEFYYTVASNKKC